MPPWAYRPMVSAFSGVFRAIRFEQRLSFHIAKHTENLIKNAVKMNFLQKLGGKRLFTELVLILRDREPLRAVERMAGLNLLQFIHPELKLNPSVRRLLDEVREIISFRELIESQAYAEMPGRLPLAMGKTVDGEPFVSTLDQMPHHVACGWAFGFGVGVGCVVVCCWGTRSSKTVQR